MKAFQGGRAGGLSPDPRTKLAILFVCGTFVFLVAETGLLVLLGFFSVYLLAERMFRKCGRFLLGFAVLFALQHLFRTYWPAAAVFGVIAFFLMRFIPVMMAASSLTAAPPGELIAALQKLRLPRTVVIPLAVGLRFLPCIASEYAAIRDAMRLRGIALMSFRTLAHPAVTLESVLVPLLMRSIKVADELAASVSVRGIDNPAPRTCLRELRFRPYDLFLLAALGAAAAAAVLCS